MSWVTYGAVYSLAPLHEADLATIDRILAERAVRLDRTRRGRVWKYSTRWAGLSVAVEDLERCGWDCEEEMLSLGLLPEPGHYRVLFSVGLRHEELDEEIDRLCEAVAVAVGGVRVGPIHCH